MGHLTQQGNSFASAPSSAPPGHIEFRIKDDDGYHLIHAVSAPGDLIHADQIVNANTLLDTESFASCIIITLGEIAEDAQKLANRLVDKKPIKVLDGKLIAEVLLSQISSALDSQLKKL